MAVQPQDVLPVATLVIKCAVGAWLQVPTLSAVSALDLGSLIGLKTADRFLQGRAKRQLEEACEHVALSIYPLLQVEAPGLDDGDRRAVLLAVEETLRYHTLSDALIFDANMQPHMIARELDARSNSRAKLRSQPAQDIYDRVLLDACTYLLEVATQMPAFQNRAFSELMRRDDVLLQAVQQIVREINATRTVEVKDSRAANFETEYRRTVARVLDVLELFGVEAASRSKRYPLSISYIELVLATLGANPESTFRPAGRPVSLPAETSAAEDVLASIPRILIRGEPGSGKTTLLKWVAVNAALRKHAGNLNDWNGLVPFFIRLRQFNDRPLPSPEEFAGLIAPAIAGEMPEHWVHGQLRGGRSILLVDGVDEVSPTRRHEVHSWLDSLVDTFPNCRYIVTTRFPAVQQGWLRTRGFVEAAIQPMDMPSTFQLIDRWHQAVSEQEYDELERTRVVELSPRLKARMRESRPLRQLASIPLLCAMLCALNRESEENIPADRIELYSAACSMLIHKREVEQQIEIAGFPALTLRQKRSLLEDMAYWMVANNATEVSKGEARTRIGLQLQNMSASSDLFDSESVLQLLLERSGILREPAAGTIDFAHKTFQEFLAAHSAANNRDVLALVNHAHDDLWNNVIVFAAGVINRSDRNDLLLRIVDRGEREQRYKHRLHLLAVACLETAVDVNPPIRDRIISNVAQLVPPRNDSEALALAAAGELAVPSLANGPVTSTAVTAASVLTLVRIGGESAAEVLEKYAVDPREAVKKRIVELWPQFEPASLFGRRILPLLFEGASAVDLQYAPSLEGFERLTDLQRIAIRDISDVGTLHAFGDLNQLRILKLGNASRIESMEPLCSLSHLDLLTLTEAVQLDAVEPLVALGRRLKSLCLTGIRSSVNLNPIGRLEGLRSLKIGAISWEDNLGWLSGLSALRELDLDGFDEITDLGALAHLVDLEKLTLTGFARAHDLSALGNLHSLSTLKLRGFASASDLEFVTHMASLTALELEGFESIEDVDPLGDIDQLEEMVLSGFDSVVDISALGDMEKIKRLTLSGFNSVEVFGEVAGTDFLKQLERVDLDISVIRAAYFDDDEVYVDNETMLLLEDDSWFPVESDDDW